MNFAGAGVLSPCSEAVAGHDVATAARETRAAFAVAANQPELTVVVFAHDEDT